MKTTPLLLLILVLFAIQTVSATVWRVNNRPNVDADFTTLQTAIDGASDGDTLYIGASETTYGAGIFAKKLIVIGAGYWLTENDTTQAYKEESQTGVLTFNNGSEGSIITGLHIYNSGYGTRYGIIINTSNIFISRNYIYIYSQYSNYYGAGPAIAVAINNNVSAINIKQNWLYANHSTNNESYPCQAIKISGILTNSSISNNFLRSQYPLSGNSIYMSTNSTATELVINNNVMWGNLITYYTIHNNNIQIEGTYNNGTSDLTSHNLCNSTQYPTTNSNQQNVDMSTMFVDYVGYIDNDYILAPDSPARGAGINGGDCGAFGNGTGGDPYILSGLPAIPTVYEATFTTMGSSVLPVNIKASSHN